MPISHVFTIENLNRLMKAQFKKHVLLIGWDGVRHSSTISEMGWVTVLTGVWADQHHLKKNSDLSSGKYNPVDYAAMLSANRQMTSDIARLMKMKATPLFIYSHYEYSDENGHLYGFSPSSKRYLDAIRQEVDEANILLKSIVRSRKKNWLIILTTDHGGHQFTHGTQLPSDRNIFAVIGTYEKNGFHGYKIKPGKQGQTAFFNIIEKYLRDTQYN